MTTTPQPPTPAQPPTPEIPVTEPDSHPPQGQPIEPTAELPPETVNLPQEDEDAQSPTVADAASGRGAEDYGLDDTAKVPLGEPDDDVQDLVDHMQNMVRLGRIDMDAYRGERNDDDEEGLLGPSGDTD